MSKFINDLYICILPTNNKTMKNTKHMSIVFFTNNLVLSEIVNRILENCIPNFNFIVFNSFAQAQSLDNSDSYKLVFVDNTIIGASSFELISYLRLEKKMNLPIIYFGVIEHDNETKAISIGANYCVTKPFNPTTFTNLIKPLLQ